MPTGAVLSHALYRMDLMFMVVMLVVAMISLEVGAHNGDIFDRRGQVAMKRFVSDFLIRNRASVHAEGWREESCKRGASERHISACQLPLLRAHFETHEYREASSKLAASDGPSKSVVSFSLCAARLTAYSFHDRSDYVPLVSSIRCGDGTYEEVGGLRDVGSYT